MWSECLRSRLIDLLSRRPIHWTTFLWLHFQLNTFIYRTNDFTLKLDGRGILSNIIIAALIEKMNIYISIDPKIPLVNQVPKKMYQSIFMQTFLITLKKFLKIFGMSSINMHRWCASSQLFKQPFTHVYLSRAVVGVNKIFIQWTKSNNQNILDISNWDLLL